MDSTLRPLNAQVNTQFEKYPVLYKKAIILHSTSTFTNKTQLHWVILPEARNFSNLFFTKKTLTPPQTALLPPFQLLHQLRAVLCNKSYPMPSSDLYRRSGLLITHHLSPTYTMNTTHMVDRYMRCNYTSKAIIPFFFSFLCSWFSFPFLPQRQATRNPVTVIPSVYA